MDYKQAIGFLQEAVPIGITPGLSRVEELLERLGNPQNQLRFVHIAGTNGKGSTAVMLAAILQEAGCRTGLFTSPYLVRYNEQIRINGTEISDKALAAVLSRVRDAVSGMQETPSEFERFLPAAFLYFAEACCDIVVLETGMGGRLDATNVIQTGEVEIITKIAMDHVAFLGDTIEAIAEEKAGIIKPHTEVVMMRQTPAAEEVIRSRCESCGAQLHSTDPEQIKVHSIQPGGQYFDYRTRKDLFLALPAVYQTENAAAVLDTVDLLQKHGWKIPEDAVRLGLKHVRWPGRFEVLQKKPLILLDGAHNADGTNMLAASLAGCFPGRKVTFIMGVLADKDYSEMIRRLSPLAGQFITTSPHNPRALSAKKLAEAIRSETEIPVQSGGTMEESIKKALESCPDDDIICICGSLYQAGAARAYFGLCS